MARFPAMPLYTDAIIADCSHLTNEEFGLYTRMLIHMWRTPECRFPNDQVWIARKLQCNFDATALPLLNEFFTSDGNWWHQKRLSEQYDYVSKRSKKQSENAKSRWNNEKDTSHGNACSGNAPKPKPIPKSKEERGARFTLTQLPDEWLEFCRKERPDLNAPSVFQSFRDWWISCPGAKGVKLDWFATWRNWVRSQRGAKASPQARKGEVV